MINLEEINLEEWGVILGVASILISLGIFYYQQRLSKEQSQLGRSLGELELREKLGPIQGHLRQARTKENRFKDKCIELQNRLRDTKERIDDLAELEETLSLIDSVLDDTDGTWCTVLVRELQCDTGSSAQRLHRLVDAIERKQRELDRTRDESNWELLEECQSYIRGLRDTAAELGEEAVYLLTDCRALEAVYNYASPDARSEIRALLAKYWSNPLERLPVPLEYKSGEFEGTTLAAALKDEAPNLCKTVNKGPVQSS